MLINAIKDKRLEVGQALEAARAISKKMQAEPEKAAEHQEAWDKAFGDFEKGKKELDRMEQQLELERQATEVEKPTNRLQYMGPEARQKAKESAHKEALAAFIRWGRGAALEVMKDFEPQEINALLPTKGDLGGFLVPDDFKAEMLRAQAGYAVFRAAGARAVPTTGNRVVWPTVKSGTDPHSSQLTSGDAQATGAGTNWKAPGHTVDGDAPPTQSPSMFGQVEIPVHLWQPDVLELDISLIEDSAVPLEPIVADLFGEIKGLDEDWSFQNGDGVNKPLGICNTGTGITTVKSGTSGAVTYGGVVDLFTALPAQYRQNAKFLMASATYGALIKLESTGGMLLFPPNALPGTLFGKPVSFSEFMPAIAADALAIAFGAFQHYIIADRVDFRIQRLVERFAPNVGILPTARLGGQLTRVEAFRLQKLEA